MVATVNDPAEASPHPLWDEERFQKLVRKAARRKGLSLSEVARLAGTSHGWLSQPATTTGRGIEKLLQITKVLDLDVVELFGGRMHRAPDAQARLRLLTTISTVTAHLAAALQLVYDGNADRIVRGVNKALVQILKEIEDGEDGKGK